MNPLAQNVMGRVALIWTPTVVEIFSYTDGGKVWSKRVLAAGKMLEGQIQ